MSLQSAARAAFAGIKARVPESVVSVIIGDDVADGIRNSAVDQANGGVYGEQGLASCTVWVDASDFERPSNGATIIVDGTDVIVTETKLDPAGAILRIDYQEQRPVEVV